MHKILISGANGFVGSGLIHKLKDKYDIFAVARNVTDEMRKLPVTWMECDISKNIDFVKWPDKLHSVIHLAQSRLYKNFPDGAEDMFGVNLHSTFQLLEYSRKAGVKYFIFASSGGVYKCASSKLTEKAAVKIDNFYLSSKYAAELLIANYKQFFKTVVLRFFFVYGPGQKGMLIPNLLNRVKNGEKITIDGNPGIKINPIFVDDAVNVFEPAMNLADSDLFNIAGEEAVTLTDLVKKMERLTGSTVNIEYKPSTANGDLIGDNTRMKTVLGINPEISIDNGLKLLNSALV